MDSTLNPPSGVEPHDLLHALAPSRNPGQTPAGCRVQGAGCKVQGAGFRVQGAGFRVQGEGALAPSRNPGQTPSAPRLTRKIGIFLPNNQRQHRSLHVQEDVLPYALCSLLRPCQPLLRAFSRWIRSPPPTPRLAHRRFAWHHSCPGSSAPRYNPGPDGLNAAVAGAQL